MCAHTHTCTRSDFRFLWQLWRRRCRRRCGSGSRSHRGSLGLGWSGWRRRLAPSRKQHRLLFDQLTLILGQPAWEARFRNPQLIALLQEIGVLVAFILIAGRAPGVSSCRLAHQDALQRSRGGVIYTALPIRSVFKAVIFIVMASFNRQPILLAISVSVSINLSQLTGAQQGYAIGCFQECYVLTVILLGSQLQLLVDLTIYR